MKKPPTLDTRSQEELLATLTDRADQYLDDWDANSPDMATTLLRIGSEFGMDIIQQLNGLPRKHRIAFFNSLGVARRPPQAARLPLSFEVAGDLDRNIAIPGGTQAVATIDGETKPFEIPQSKGFEATPSSLIECVAVDPSVDRIVEHGTLVDGEPERLFDGHNEQQHALYLGDESLLTLDPGSVIEIQFTGELDDQALDAALVWEYYGVDEDAEDDTEGWHRLLTVDQEEMASELRTDSTPNGASSIPDQLDALSAAPQQSTDDDQYSATLKVPGELVETTVAATDSQWIRCRLDEPDPASVCFATEIEAVRAHVGQSTQTSQTTPDVFANDMPLSVDEETDIRPFGRLPQPPATVYLAADEALSKAGAVVRLSFAPPTSTDEPSTDDERSPKTDTHPEQQADFGALDGPPELSWEYWNGTGWSRLSIRSDDTDSLQTNGEVEFVVPDDTTETAVSGHEKRWIRARLVGGSYGESVTDPDPPRYSTISMQYDHTDASFSHLIAENNNSFETDPARSVDQFKPFVKLPEDSQTLYFGFDDVLQNGPISILMAIGETSYPQGFDSGIEWEYCTDHEIENWTKLAVEDETGGLTERGIVSLNFAESTQPHDRFGTNCHWVRAVVTADRFATTTPERTHTDTTTATQSEMTYPAVDTAQSTTPVARPPICEGVYLNTQWADNARTVENEILGSSDGSDDQTFQCAHGPVIDAEVWVDEAESLSASERAELQEENPDRVDAVTDHRGELASFWVKWMPVDDFLDTDHRTRAYRLDRSTGTVRFGDGDRGKIPPRGQDSIRATYTTGGGRDGNVDPETVTELKTPISLVDSVSNPTASDGGAGIEPAEAAVSRAANRIKTRGKAVTASDFEQVAAAAVRTLAAVECKPQLGPDGNRNPGWMTLLVVPDAQRDHPMPSMELEQRVHQAVSEVAPATLTEGDRSRIIVRGPTYAAVSVDVTVHTTGVKSISLLKTRLEETLTEYLHPLSGGSDNTGWEFGESPSESSIESLVRSVSGVDTVVGITTEIQLGEDQRSLTQRRSSPAVPTDGLVCNGSHDITVQVGEQS